MVYAWIVEVDRLPPGAVLLDLDLEPAGHLVRTGPLSQDDLLDLLDLLVEQGCGIVSVARQAIDDLAS